VQSLIYQDDLAYQPDGRLAVDANAGVLATFQTRAMPMWRMEESSRHTIPPLREGFRYEDVTLISLHSKPGVWDWIGKSTLSDLDVMF